MRFRRAKGTEAEPSPVVGGAAFAQVPLSQVIKRVSADLKASRDDQGVLELRDCAIELGVSIQADAGGDVQVYVFSLGAHVAATAHSKVTLRFGAVSDPLTGLPPTYLLSPSSLRLSGHDEQTPPWVLTDMDPKDLEPDNQERPE